MLDKSVGLLGVGDDMVDDVGDNDMVNNVGSSDT